MQSSVITVTSINSFEAIVRRASFCFAKTIMFFRKFFKMIDLYRCLPSFCCGVVLIFSVEVVLAKEITLCEPSAKVWDNCFGKFEDSGVAFMGIWNDDALNGYGFYRDRERNVSLRLYQQGEELKVLSFYTRCNPDSETWNKCFSYYKFDDGASYTGEWNNNNFNGYGFYIYANGLVQSGFWRNGDLTKNSTSSVDNGNQADNIQSYKLAYQRAENYNNQNDNLRQAHDRLVCDYISIPYDAAKIEKMCGHIEKQKRQNKSEQTRLKGLISQELTKAENTGAKICSETKEISSQLWEGIANQYRLNPAKPEYKIVRANFSGFLLFILGRGNKDVHCDVTIYLSNGVCKIPASVHRVNSGKLLFHTNHRGLPNRCN